MRASLDAAKERPTDGLLQLVAGEVREIQLPVVVDGKKTDEMHAIDVIHRPVEEENPDGLPVNEAHSQIESNPALGDARFKKLKEFLARIAQRHGWVSAPTQS